MTLLPTVRTSCYGDCAALPGSARVACRGARAAAAGPRARPRPLEWPPVTRHPRGRGDERSPAGDGAKYRLDNGLEMILVPDPATSVSFTTWFRVGSRHETPPPAKPAWRTCSST